MDGSATELCEKMQTAPPLRRTISVAGKEGYRRKDLCSFRMQSRELHRRRTLTGSSQNISGRLAKAIEGLKDGRRRRLESLTAASCS